MQAIVSYIILLNFVRFVLSNPIDANSMVCNPRSVCRATSGLVIMSRQLRLLQIIFTIISWDERNVYLTQLKRRNL